jgi:hypothetical protein
MSSPKKMIDVTYNLRQLKEIMEKGDYIRPEYCHTWFVITSVDSLGFIYNGVAVSFNNGQNSRFGWIPLDLMELATAYSSGRVATLNAKQKQAKFKIEDI